MNENKERARKTFQSERDNLQTIKIANDFADNFQNLSKILGNSKKSFVYVDDE